jgi:hypothetical protein
MAPVHRLNTVNGFRLSAMLSTGHAMKPEPDLREFDLGHRSRVLTARGKPAMHAGSRDFSQRAAVSGAQAN